MAEVVKEKLALLRTKLDQIPALQQAEVSETFETKAGREWTWVL
jgi:hypothetical protein